MEMYHMKTTPMKEESDIKEWFLNFEGLMIKVV